MDHVVVTRTLNGGNPGRALHVAERVELARRVLAAGGGYNRVMELLHCSGDVARCLIAEAKATTAAAGAR